MLRAVAARVALRPDRPAERAHAPPLGDADARALVARDRGAASVQSRVPLFCRHNRLTANCPICSRELAAERAGAPRPPGPRARAARARPAAPAAPPRRRHQARRPRGRRRLPQPARPRPARDRRRRAPRRRARAGPTPGSSRPARTRRSPRSRCRRRRSGSRSCSRSSRPARTSCTRRSSPSRPGWASDEVPEHPRRRPAHRSPPTAPGPSAPARRPTAFLGEPAWTPERRFGRVFERLALPGLRPRAPRYELLADARRRRPLDARGRRAAPRRGDDATTLAAKRVLVSGDAMLLERRAARSRRGAAGCRSARSTAALAVWGDGRDATAGERARRRSARRSALRERRRSGSSTSATRASPRRSSRSSAPPTASRPTCSARARCPR